MFSTVLLDTRNAAKTQTLARTQFTLCMGTRLHVGMPTRCPLCTWNTDNKTTLLSLKLGASYFSEFSDYKQNRQINMRLKFVCNDRVCWVRMCIGLFECLDTLGWIIWFLMGIGTHYFSSTLSKVCRKVEQSILRVEVLLLELAVTRSQTGWSISL